jgi:hypothetical protein
VNDQWWLMQPRPGLVLWARLREHDDGVAEILDSTGSTLRFDDEDAARHSLLTSEYVALDGLDADDALEMGLDVETLMPPEGKDERSLVHAMTQPTSN